MTSFNLMESIIDEVALEGLDGITLQALWIRLANRFHDPLPLSKPFMEQVWSIIKKVKDFSFYELETPREPLVIFDRYEFVDPCLGIILEPPNVPPDIYPHCPIQDPKAGVRGSCSTYYTRKDIKNNVKNADLDEVTEKYGLSLVIVASQLIRTRALISVDVSPTLELTIMHYCFLERVGRARYHGEVTQGKLSLAALKEDPKTLFYHRKFLLHHKLITKQIHHQKTSSHTGSSSLLHLPRFYVERKPKMIYLAEQVLDILKSKENGVAEYDEIKRKLGIENSIKKLFRNSFFQKIAKTDICVPYRTLYPNAEPKEWRQKQDPSKEKKIRVVQLLYPDIDIVDITWNKYEKDDDEDVIDMDVSNHKVNVPYLKQANAIIEASQLEGVSQAYLGKEMGLTKLQSRTFLRNMVKMGIIAKYMNDMGRQRITKYVSKKFEKGSKMSKQFNKEIHKIKELTKRITSDSDFKNKATLQVEDEKSSINNDDKDDQTINNDNKDDQTINNDDKDDQTSQKSDHQVNQTNVDAPIVNESEEKNKDIDCIKKNIELKNYTINRLMHKYQLSISKYKSKYKRTSQSLLVKMKNSNINVKKQKVKPNISSMQQIANAKATSFYNSIKTNLTAQKPVHTEKGVNEVFGFMEAVQNSEKNTSNITYRLLRRANMIIEAVKEHQVIDDISKLTKMICEEEDKEGYDVKIDKKSLIRLLQKLAKDNLVKNIKLTLSANGRTERNMMFICDPNIDTDHTVIKSAVEQAKVKFCLTSSQKAKKADRQDKEDKNKENIVDKPSDSKEQLQELSKTVSKNTLFSVKYESDTKAGKQYGLSPKFIRMQTMHILLFYLVYDHPGIPKLSQQEQIEILKSNDYEIDDNLIQEFSTIYNIEVGWKMFVPPLPKHSGWPEGWALMCDVLLGLPLSIFVKVHNITFIIPELEHYLNHPIRKHYLVKNLPVTIRNTLLHARKYIFNIHETVTRLCYFGLVQFGPQRLKDKDQVFIYLNRYTELMDTTSSAPSYHKIEDKVYPVTKYFFDRMQVVEKYWYDIWTICVNTPLGERLPVHGKDILVEDLNKKTAMIEAIVARTPKQTTEMDTGAVPGDRKGAAGIDSAFFTHLKRSWNGSVSSTNRQASKNHEKFGTGQRDLHLSKIQTKPVKYTEYDGLKKISGPPPPTISATELRKKMYDHLNGRKNEALPSQQSTKQKCIVRRVEPRKKSARRNKYDESDYQALQRMPKLRADWESHEDNILLVCKVAATYLSSNPRKQLIDFIAVRDVLCTFSYNSDNKTSCACQRRLTYMLRQPRTVNSIALGVEEIKQDLFVDRRYGSTMERLKNECVSSADYKNRITEIFKELVGYIIKKYYDITEINPKKHMAMPRTAQEFNLLFELIYPAKPHHNQGFTKDVRSTNDIHAATINSLIHSSMCCKKDRRTWAYQLFKVYQRYPDILLRQAMNKIRSDQMVTVKKHHLASVKKFGNYMPTSSSQYQLSINYIHKLQTKWPYEMFKKSYDVFAKLLQWYSEHKNVPSQQQEEILNGTEILPVSCGIVTVIHDLLGRNQIDFDIEMPEQIIMLDARYQDKNETFRVEQRYQDILTRLYRFKYENVDAQNAEFFESEMESSKDSSTRKRPIENDDYEKLAKIARRDEECNEKKPGEEFEQNKMLIVTESGSDESIGNLNLKDHSSVHKQDEKKVHRSKKRFIDIEDESMDYEESFLKRARLNSENSTDIEDIEKDEELNLCENLESIRKISSKKTLESLEPLRELKNQVREEALSTQPSTTTNVAVPRRVNEIIKNVPSETSFSPFNKLNDTNDIEKKYTRIDMLGMKGISEADRHHAHEYFVVNSFKMFYSLETSSLAASSASSNEIENFKNYSVPSQLIPLRIDAVNDLLNELNRTAIFPKSGISYTDYKDEIMTKKKKIPVEWKYVDAVCEFVREKKEIGVCSQELQDKFFDEQGTNLYKAVSLLTENHIFLRSGVTNPRYIHHRYVDSWLIHSCKIYRLEQESVVPFKDSIYAKMQQGETVKTSIEMNAKQNKEDTEIDSAIPSTSSDSQGKEVKEVEEKKDEKADNGLSNEDEEKEDSEINEETHGKRMHKQRTCLLPQRDVYKSVEQLDSAIPSTSSDSQGKKVEDVEEKKDEKADNGLSNEDEKKEDSEINEETHGKRIHKQRTCLLPQRDVYKSAQQLDFTTTEEIKVVIKPWIRVDGVLNRKVLDRMLGAVMNYCLLHPGLTMEKVQSRFIPVLQPFHTRELVEILIKLGCLESKHLKKTRVTIFSRPSAIKINNITADTIDWFAEDEIVLEPAVDAVIKFSIFLSERLYSTDFIP